MSRFTERAGAFALTRGLASTPVGASFRGTEPLEPIFIVGSGRSGSTLLRRMLVEQGEVHIPPETYVLGPIVREFALYRYLPWRVVVRKVVSTFEGYPEFHHLGIQLRPIEASLVGLPSPDRSLAQILDRIYRYHSECTGSGTARWGDKTPLNARYLPELQIVFPDGRFVHLLRDGCDVVFSLLEMGRYDSLETAAIRWRSAVEAVRAFAVRYPSSVLEVRYEDLAQQPEPTLQRICSWIHVEFAESMIGPAMAPGALGDASSLSHHRRALLAVDAASVGRGRGAFDHASLVALQGLIGGTLLACGYPPAA